MTKYNIAPFEMTTVFEECWYAAIRLLNTRVRDCGGAWIRTSFPIFREHLAFALGNQIFFIQLVNADNERNGWWQPSRLSKVVADANGIGCLMPMRFRDNAWAPVETGWGLIDMETGMPIAPAERVTDEAIPMTPWEIHDVGVDAARQFLSKNGWTVTSWQSDLEVDPSIFAGKDGQLCGFVVRSASVGLEKGARPTNAKQIAERMRSRGWGAKFIGLKITAHDDELDARVQHPPRPIYRRSRLHCTPVEIEELDVLLQ